MDETVITTV